MEEVHLEATTVSFSLFPWYVNWGLGALSIFVVALIAADLFQPVIKYFNKG